MNAPGTEFRGACCCGSEIGWVPHIYKVLSGSITRILTPINTCVTVLDCALGLGKGLVVGVKLGSGEGNGDEDRMSVKFGLIMLSHAKSRR